MADRAGNRHTDQHDGHGNDLIHIIPLDVLQTHEHQNANIDQSCGSCSSRNDGGDGGDEDTGKEQQTGISTHIVSDIETIAKELILLSEGNVIQHGTPESLIRTLENMVWQAQITVEELPTMGSYGTVAAISKGIEKVNVRLISQEKPPIPVRRVEPSLEDVYLYFFGECEANEI